MPPSRQLELSLLGGEGAREGAARMAEELALDQLLGNGRAVDLHERPRAAEALVVDVAGHELLARAVLAEDQHPPVGRRRLGDVRAQRVQDRALPHHDPAVLDLLLEGAVLRLQLALAQRVLDHEQRLLEGERLLDEVLRAHAHGLDRGLDGAVAGDDDHRHLGVERADAGQDLEPVHAGQPHVEEEQVVAAVLQRGEGRPPRSPPPPPRSPRRPRMPTRELRTPVSSSTTRIDSRIGMPSYPFYAGSSMTNRAPCGRLSSTRMTPWCSCTMRLHDGEAEPAPPLLGREVRHEQLVARRPAGCRARRRPRPGGRGPASGRTRWRSITVPLLVRGVDRVVDEVDEHALHLVGVEAQRGHVRAQAPLDASRPRTARRRATASAR